LRDLFAVGSFRHMVATQFLTVFNDNAFRQTVLLLALAADSAGFGSDPQARAGLVFALPFLVFAVFAGDVADRFSKRGVIVAAKWAEVGVMALATFALFAGSLPFGVAALFLMGAQSAFLSPAKYGIIPEIVARRDLGRANGLMHSSVLVGIILGQSAAGIMKSALPGAIWSIPLLLALLALFGVWIARKIAPVPVADPQRRLRLNPFARLPAGMAIAWRNKPLFAVMMAHGVFHLIGGVFLYSWNQMGVRELGQNEGLWSAALALLSVALAAGSLLAGRLCRNRLRAGLVPLGGVILAATMFAVAAGPRSAGYAFGVLMCGYVAAGLFLVPLNTLLQQLPDEAEKGLAQGASITLDWLFLVAASFLKEGLTMAGIGAADSFWVLGGIMLVTTLLLVRLGPDAARAIATIRAREQSAPRP